VAVLIDPPAWPAHGRLWSHLVSDTSLAELHGFTRGLGVPARGFEGDHYDVPQERYQAAVTAGAEPVSGRELLLRLQASGLRRPKRRGERVLASVPHEPSGLRLDVLSSALPPPGEVRAVQLMAERDTELLVVAAGGALSWPRAVVAPGEGAGTTAARLLGQLLGARAVGHGVPSQLGFLRYVPHPLGTAAGFELLLHWTAPAVRSQPRREPEPPARWMPAEQAIRGLPPVLAVLLPGDRSRQDPARAELWAQIR
jgi:hypothetical protein